MELEIAATESLSSRSSGDVCPPRLFAGSSPLRYEVGDGCDLAADAPSVKLEPADPPSVTLVTDGTGVPGGITASASLLPAAPPLIVAPPLTPSSCAVAAPVPPFCGAALHDFICDLRPGACMVSIFPQYTQGSFRASG